MCFSTEVLWNDARQVKADPVYKRPYWTKSFPQWSPLGTYLTTVHRQGVKLIDFSPSEKYLVTYSSQEPTKPHDSHSKERHKGSGDGRGGNKAPMPAVESVRNDVLGPAISESHDSIGKDRIHLYTHEAGIFQRHTNWLREKNELSIEVVQDFSVDAASKLFEQEIRKVLLDSIVRWWWRADDDDDNNGGGCGGWWRRVVMMGGWRCEVCGCGGGRGGDELEVAAVVASGGACHLLTVSGSRSKLKSCQECRSSSNCFRVRVVKMRFSSSLSIGTFGGIGTASLLASLLTSVLSTTLEYLLALGICSADGYIAVVNFPVHRQKVVDKVKRIADSLARKLEEAMQRYLLETTESLENYVKFVSKPYQDLAQSRLDELVKIQGELTKIEERVTALRIEVQNLLEVEHAVKSKEAINTFVSPSIHVEKANVGGKISEVTKSTDDQSPHDAGQSKEVSDAPVTTEVKKAIVGDETSEESCMDFPNLRHPLFVFFCSYEDWGVDELIAEDSWKRQVGGATEVPSQQVPDDTMSNKVAKFELDEKKHLEATIQMQNYYREEGNVGGRKVAA
ncbi:hypothetical protein Tco_1105873 [Tanacetum coccineum]